MTLIMGENAVCRILYLGGLLESSLPGSNIDPARLVRHTDQTSLVGTVWGDATCSCIPGQLSWVQRTQTIVSVLYSTQKGYCTVCVHSCMCMRTTVVCE